MILPIAAGVVMILPIVVVVVMIIPIAAGVVMILPIGAGGAVLIIPVASVVILLNLYVCLGGGRRHTYEPWEVTRKRGGGRRGWGEKGGG